MYFLIGVIILIAFVLIAFVYIKLKIRSILNKAGFSGMNLKDVIEEARLEDQEVPKSLASMDRIFLKKIKTDFPEIHIDELKRISEKVILDCFNAVEKKDCSKLKGKIKSFAEDFMNDYQDKEVHFNNYKIHNTVISNYHHDKGFATINFASSFEYCLEIDGSSKKVQDRAKTEFIYVIDEAKLPKDIHVLGIHCPNCGSPITTLGEKKCSYCGSAVLEVVSKVFTCHDIVRY